MLCPHCKVEIEFVRVYSECYQNAELEGNKIADYGAVEEITETIDIECPYCGHDIRELIEE